MYSNDSPGTERARSEFTVFDATDEDSPQLASGMVLLAGVDAVVAARHGSRVGDAPGAETGWPETLKEFAQRVRSRFVLRGPQEQMEGGNGSTQPTTPYSSRRNTDVNSGTHLITNTSGSDGNPSQRDPVQGTTDFGPDHFDTDHVNHVNPLITDSITEPIPEASLVNILENDAGIDLLKELKGHYQEDPIFQSVLDKPKEFRNFKVKDGLVYLKLNGTNLLCIPKMTINGRSVHEIVISEAHSLLAHLGANKTLNYL